MPAQREGAAMVRSYPSVLRRPGRPRVRPALVAAFVMLTALVTGAPFAPPGHAAAAASTLLSQGRPATASSVEKATTPASAAVDGDTTTRWSSAFSDPQWLQVDLGSSQPICHIDLNWEAAYASAFQIQTSQDAVTWTTIYSTTTGAGNIEALNVSGTGR